MRKNIPTIGEGCSTLLWPAPGRVAAFGAYIRAEMEGAGRDRKEAVLEADGPRAARRSFENFVGISSGEGASAQGRAFVTSFICLSIAQGEERLRS